MQTRFRAKASACAMDSNIRCWLPKELQFKLLDDALKQYAMPLLRGGLVRNPASEVVSLMLVCRTWRDYVLSHPYTCHRQVSTTGLRIAWLYDTAHLACTEAQPKKAKLKRIPQTVQLLLCDGSDCHGPACCHVAAFGREASGISNPASWRSCCDKNCEHSQDSNNRGSGIRDGSRSGSGKPLARAEPNSSSINSRADTVITIRSQQGFSWGSWRGSRWCQARVLSSQRSPFERSSFPERVPLLALEATHISRLELRWLVAVAASLDINFLCPLVLRITFPAAATTGKAAGVGPGGAGPAALPNSSTATAMSAAAPLESAVATSQPCATSTGPPNVDALTAVAAVNTTATAAGAVLGHGGGDGAVAVVDTRGVSAGRAVEGERCAQTEGEELQWATQTLTQADVAALESLTLTVGGDGPHLYLVPTAAALQRSWPRT